MRLFFLLMFLPATVLASDFTTLQGDAPLAQEEVITLTERHLLEFYEGGQSRYSAGGSYSYTYRGGSTSFGQFDIGPDGVICVAFNNGRERCDQFVHSHGRLVMITQSGDRFPIRP